MAQEGSAIPATGEGYINGEQESDTFDGPPDNGSRCPLGDA
jgi:hypothetical protein